MQSSLEVALGLDDVEPSMASFLQDRHSDWADLSLNFPSSQLRQVLDFVPLKVAGGQAMQIVLLSLLRVPASQTRQ